jgi:hypothetical protein
MAMHEATERFLTQVKQTPLFTASGLKDCDDPAVVVASWAEAAAVSQKDANRQIRTEQQREILQQTLYEKLDPASESLGLTAPQPLCEEYGPWAETLDQVEAAVDLIVSPVLLRLPLSEPERRAVWAAASWDLIHAGMEHHYAAVLQTRFYRDLAAWYLRGHFVCGWDYSEGYFRTLLY